MSFRHRLEILVGSALGAVLAHVVHAFPFLLPAVLLWWVWALAMTWAERPRRTP